MADRDYQDFELNIESLSADKLRVTVVTSPVGSVAVEVANTLAPDEIARIIGILDGSVRTPRAEAARQARTFGEKLFGLVFSGQIYAAYLASQSRAAEHGLRIKLGLENAGVLETLPWELLRDPNGDYLVLSRQTPVLRYPRLLTVRPLVDVTLPLRVLVMISSPNDQAELDVEAEWHALEEATADLRTRGLLELHRIDDAHLNVLQRKLREGTSFQVFHYIGHASFDERSETGMLAFEDPRTGGTLPVSGEALARELSEENSIRLVVLNACQGARKNQSDPYAGVASSIVARGVPAVVAMQFEISDAASKAFSAEFYRVISEGYSIEAATAEARRSISTTLNNLEWATPVLYLRAPSGVLFPKRSSAEGQANAGGLRSALMRAPILAVLGLLGVVFATIFVASAIQPTPGPTTPTAQILTLTPTSNAPKDVDLVISSVRFLPPNPIPGQQTTIAIRIENRGKSESGPFEWVWFAANPQQNQPTLRGTVANLSPGLGSTIIANFRFPWWGTYTTTAWVNFELKIPESNQFNNFQARTVSTGEDPFDVDFSRLPDGTLLEAAALDSAAFEAWGFSAVARGLNECTDAVAKVNINLNGFSELIAGRADGVAGCEMSPIEFVINAVDDSPQVVSVTVGFTATVPGAYQLSLLGGGGEVIRKETRQINAVDSNQVQTITLSANAGTFDLARVLFSTPNGGQTVIRQFTRAIR